MCIPFKHYLLSAVFVQHPFLATDMVYCLCIMFIKSQKNVHFVALIEHSSTYIVCVNLHYAVTAYKNVD